MQDRAYSSGNCTGFSPDSQLSRAAQIQSKSNKKIGVGHIKGENVIQKAETNIRERNEMYERIGVNFFLN